MTTDEQDRLRFPIGRYQPRPALSPEDRQGLIDDIAAVPHDLRGAVSGLSDAQLDTPYRPGGWTVRQVVHHLPDSHLNAYVRFRLTVTEPEPTIKPYDEAAWAELADARTGEVGTSLVLLEALHDRWTQLLRSFQQEEWSRAYHHPERGPVTLEENLQLYAWHGRHHLAHITQLHQRMGW